MDFASCPVASLALASSEISKIRGDVPPARTIMPIFRRLHCPPAEMPADHSRLVPCALLSQCPIHNSQVYRDGEWSNLQQNTFEVFWQKILHFKFDHLCGRHELGKCDAETFDAFTTIVRIRGLVWEEGIARYVEE